jgi:asparagine synthase (glutamine-hydrolysing)
MQARALQRSSLADLFATAAEDFAPNLSVAEQAMRLDMCFTLPDDYLQKVDRSSMAFSLESREPLLDQDLVEWCMKLPLCWKMRGRQRKYLLRKLLYRYVPRELVDRRKMGFGVPMAQWLRGPLRSWANERFHSAELFSDLPIDQQRVLDLYALHCTGRRNVAPLLWALLVLLERFRPQTC